MKVFKTNEIPTLFEDNHSPVPENLRFFPKRLDLPQKCYLIKSRRVFMVQESAEKAALAAFVTVSAQL